MLSTIIMLGRLGRAVRHAFREEGFGALLAVAATLVVAATVAYCLGEGWGVVDGLYFAVGMLTTTNVADPDLTLDSGWLKIFTIAYQLLGIGVVVELVRRLAVSGIAVRTEEREAKRRRDPEGDEAAPPA